MTTPIELSERAAADIEAIENYLVAETGPRIARAVLQRLYARLDLLGTFPEAAPLREAWGEGIRALMAPPYVVAYEIHSERDSRRVFVLRVLHGARDIPALLKGD